MLKQIARLRVGLVILLGILLFCSDAFAMAVRRRDNSRDERGDNRRNDKRDNRKDSREGRHYYRNDRWYRRDSRGNEIPVLALSIGAFIDALPSRHTTLVIQGAPYYHDDRYYFRQHPNGGYVVVAPPVIVQPQPHRSSDNRGERDSNWHNEENRGENR
ncbi:MAG: hypothetical protein WC335_06930 [Candidatus Omnitrophota bacterium]|jgi:hypothetical protein